MQQAHIDRTVTGSKIPGPRDPSVPQAACSSGRRQHVWSAWTRRGPSTPPHPSGAEEAVFTHHRPVARTIATDAAPAYGLSDGQAEQLADRGLAKAIRDCRAWAIHGFELYVHAAVESELRNTVSGAHHGLQGGSRRIPVSKERLHLNSGTSRTKSTTEKVLQ